jgi:hypothetical protein
LAVSVEVLPEAQTLSPASLAVPAVLEALVTF